MSMIFYAFAVALSMDQPDFRSAPRLQLPSADVTQIVQVVLEAVIPKERREGPRFRDELGNRTLMFDTARTTEAFRRIDPQVGPDYREVKRAFVARSRSEAIACESPRSLKCRVADDGVYASVTTVEPDTSTGGYRLKLLVLRSQVILHGYEQELFVVKGAQGWRVERFGVIRVIN